MTSADVNTLSYQQLREFWAHPHKWKSEVTRAMPDGTNRVVLISSLKPTKAAGHPQVSWVKFGFGPRKPQLHALWWRWENRDDVAQTCPLIDESLHLSHVDSEEGSVNCVAESVQENESRKYCHLFRWYSIDPVYGRARCPHWENPCSGP